MPQTGTQQTKIECSRCGKTFSSLDELREHEKNCQGRSVAADTPGSAKPEKNLQTVETDMEIEDRFEGSDN